YGFVFLMAAMFGSALTLASFVKVIYSVFLGPKTEKTAGVKKEVGFTMFLPMVVLAILCLILGIFYQILIPFLNPMREGIAPIGIWDSTLATVLILVGLVVGFLIFLMGKLLKSARVVKPFIGGETLEMGSDRVSGTHFYDTIKDLPLLKKIYSAQEKGFLDPYNWFGGAGLAVTGLLKKVHNGLLPFYLSWTLLGSVVLLIVFTVLA
ncbi:MAG TPA: hypothetical protein VMX75_10850, partial [Spirochaetia bacterium]|nr:hypothetical protein [Spirochaetia bacterium]